MPDHTTMRNAGRPSGWCFAVLVLICLGAATFAGYQRIFSSFAVYDDEGYVMISVRSFLEGHPLYDETYTQYGPAYYWIQSLIHHVTGWGVTHDITRLKTLGLWVAAAVLAMFFVYRLTSCRVASLVGFLLAFFHLERLSMEPGHPQGLCVLATIACLVLATYVPATGGRSWLFAALGALVGLVAMTKANVGVFLLTAISLAMLVAMPDGRFRRTLLPVWIAFSLLLPGLVFGRQLAVLAAVPLPVVAIASLSASVFVACRTIPLRSVSLWNLGSFWTMCGVVALGVAGLTLLGGTTPWGLLDGLVLQHRAFGTVFAAPYIQAPPVPLAAIPVAGLAALAAVVSLRGSAFTLRTVRFLVTVALVAVCLRHAAESRIPLVHGAQDRGLAMMLTSGLLPLVWIILLPQHARANDPGAARSGRAFFARLMLCTIASLAPLAAYPCPGTQLATASLGVLLAMVVGFADQFQTEPGSGRWERLMRRGPMLFVAAATLATLGIRGYCQWDARSRMEPLGFVGAERLRLPSAEMLEKRWLVRQLQTHADTFIHLNHGYNSLYFWTEIPPPTAWNATLWRPLFSPAQQDKILRAFLSHRNPCIVVQRSTVRPRQNAEASRNTLANPTGSSLVAYVSDNFVPMLTRGDTEIWMLATRVRPGDK